MSDLSHLQLVRQQMPAATSHIYLNTGTFGPLPACVVQAMQECIQYEWQNGRLGADAFQRISDAYNTARASVARLLNADVQEVALTDNTGEGMNIISFGISWHAGDEVITTNHEHISALAPLYQIRDRYGVIIRVADLGTQADRPALDAISELVTSRTRLVVLSHVTWTTGAVLDIQAVGRMGRARGIPVLVDGAQSAGSVPIDVKALDVDFYAIPMQKWLCGPDGTGALYARQDAQHHVISTYVGYFSIKHEEGVEWALKEDAQRFELGGRQTAAIMGQAAVLNWLEEFVGHQWQFQRISHLNAYACEALKQLPTVTVLTPRPGASGIVTFKLEGHDAQEVVQQLREKHAIYIRSILSAGTLRVSTGFYNTEEEIDTLVRALAEL
ncbi:MAG TPA: aminotransferase class V-fold PLP-dependent enzyme [Ktedonobacteraceae bacterium]|nr:aminotransferase class V-fold PLP-dependent enzyme [Ktedonobacteraceae bacterium]